MVVVATVDAFPTVGFFLVDKPTVNSNCGLTVATQIFCTIAPTIFWGQLLSHLLR